MLCSTLTKWLSRPNLTDRWGQESGPKYCSIKPTGVAIPQTKFAHLTFEEGDFALQSEVEQSWLPRWPRPNWCTSGQRSAALANRFPIFYDRATHYRTKADHIEESQSLCQASTRLSKGCNPCQVRLLSSLGTYVAESSNVTAPEGKQDVTLRQAMAFNRQKQQAACEGDPLH